MNNEDVKGRGYVLSYIGQCWVELFVCCIFVAAGVLQHPYKNNESVVALDGVKIKIHDKSA